jgi:hypothetical protein
MIFLTCSRIASRAPGSSDNAPPLGPHVPRAYYGRRVVFGFRRTSKILHRHHSWRQCFLLGGDPVGGRSRRQVSRVRRAPCQPEPSNSSKTTYAPSSGALSVEKGPAHLRNSRRLPSE